MTKTERESLETRNAQNLYIHRLTCVLDTKSTHGYEYDMCVEVGDPNSQLRKFIGNDHRTREWTAEVELKGNLQTCGHKTPLVEVFDAYPYDKKYNLGIFLKASGTANKKGKVKIRDSKQPIVDPRIKKLDFVRMSPGSNRYSMTIEMLEQQISKVIQEQDAAGNEIIAVYTGGGNDPLTITKDIDFGKYASTELAPLIISPDPKTEKESHTVVYFDV